MPIMTLDPAYVTTGKSKCCQCEPRQLDGADPTMCEYCELVEQNKRLKEELDTWKKAYVTAENESRRFQEAYEEIYQKLREYKS